MTFPVIARRSAKKFLDNLQEEDKERIVNKLKLLATDPFPREVVRVIGKSDEKVFRVRVGHYRILYIVDFNEKLIIIDDIDKRQRIYD